MTPEANSSSWGSPTATSHARAQQDGGYLKLRQASACGNWSSRVRRVGTQSTGAVGNSMVAPQKLKQNGCVTQQLQVWGETPKR